jgi:hypothetical protein
VFLLNNSRFFIQMIKKFFVIKHNHKEILILCSLLRYFDADRGFQASNKLYQLLRLYSVGDKCIKCGRGALLERYWLGKSKIPEKNLSHYHYVYHKPHMEWPGIELLPPRYEAGGQPPNQWRGSKQNKKKRLRWHYMCSGTETENMLLWSVRPLVLTLNMCWRK